MEGPTALRSKHVGRGHQPASDGERLTRRDVKRSPGHDASQVGHRCQRLQSNPDRLRSPHQLKRSRRRHRRLSTCTASTARCTSGKPAAGRACTGLTQHAYEAIGTPRVLGVGRQASVGWPGSTIPTEIQPQPRRTDAYEANLGCESARTDHVRGSGTRTRRSIDEFRRHGRRH